MSGLVVKRAKDMGHAPADPWVQSAVRYLARFDRTAGQVERFLRGKGASSVQAKRAVGRLVELRYLDDRAYAERWIGDRLTRKPMGRERLRGELLGTGIDEFLVDRTIRKALSGVDEDTLARRALGIRQRRSPLSPVQSLRLLRQRGFDEDTIARIIEGRAGTEGT